MRFQNAIREGLDNGDFLYTLEYVPDLLSEGLQALDNMAKNAEKVGQNPRIRGLNIGDRVKSTKCFSTVECGKIAADASRKIPLLHLAGKDRLPDEAKAVFQSALDYGLSNMLLVTGDRIAEPTREGRTRYHESVIAIQDVKNLYPHATIASAISPFKYREEELANQYLKMAKKINVGTNYLITNCGWDMKKFQELIWYRDGRGFKTPIVANLLLPTLGWAKGIHSGRLPGVHLSDDLFHKILEDYDEGKSVAREKSFHRLAVMIVGIKLMGYAGVQLSGVDDYETLTEVIELADNIEKSISSKQEWNELWENSNRLKSGKIANSSPNPSGIYLFNSENKPEFGSIESFPSINSVTASEDEIKKFNFMNGIHNHLFKDGSIGASIFKPISKVFDSNNFSRKVFLNIEHATTNKTLG